VVREDAETLYAFASKEERDLFETLITLSGIGPKTALAIIGHMELSLFRQAILGSDVRLLSKIPGIGKKSAERLILEMRSKLQGKGEEALPISGAGGVVTDAMNALIHLGYNPQEAHKAIQKALQEKQGEQDLGKIISSALQNI
jgi:Holliday junction DNA helicase RuvA